MSRVSPFVKVIAIAAVIGASLLVAVLGRAQSGKPSPPTPASFSAPPVPASGEEVPQAEIRVRVIHARNDVETTFDPHLEDLRGLLKGFTNYHFTELVDATLKLGLSEEMRTKGMGLHLSGKSMTVTLKSLTPEKATIRVLMVGQTGPLLDTTVSAGPHKLFFIAGPRYDDGVLFVAIEPHYDPEALKGPPVVDSGAGVNIH